MIRDISQDELLDNFYRLVAEVECGDHFDFDNERHDQWLRQHVSRDFARGVRFFARFADDNTPVGYAGLLVEEPLDGVAVIGRSAELLSIGVQSQFRRRGYGTELLRHAESLSTAAGCTCLYIATYAGSHDVIHFYGRNGYPPVATLPDVHGPSSEGRVWMRKILAAST